MSFIEDVAEVADPGGLFAGLTGTTQAKAAQEAAEAQAGASREALALLRSDLDPFRQLGAEQIPGAQALASDRDVQNQLLQSSPEFQQLQALSTDPQAQTDFLGSNPLFASLREQASQDIFANQAARGKLGSTGTEELLQSRFLELGDSLINQQISRTQGALGAREDVINQQLNRQLPLLNIGQASAAQVGAGSSELLTGIGNAQAAGGIAAANAQAQGAQNVAGLGIAALAAFSDVRLKEDIKVIGSHNGHDVISWSWNSKASDIGLTGGGTGHRAQDIQKTHPHLAYENNGILMINYCTDETVEPTTWQ